MMEGRIIPFPQRDEFSLRAINPPLTMLISYFRLQVDVKTMKGERPGIHRLPLPQAGARWLFLRLPWRVERLQGGIPALVLSCIGYHFTFISSHLMLKDKL